MNLEPNNEAVKGTQFHRERQSIDALLDSLKALPPHLDCIAALNPMLDLKQAVEISSSPTSELHKAVAVTFELIADLRGLSRLNDPMVDFSNRLEWISVELELAGTPDTSQSTALRQRCEHFRAYYAENSGSVPTHATLEYERALELGKFSEALSNLHQIAGSVELLRKSLYLLADDPDPVQMQSSQIALERICTLLLHHTGPLAVPNEYAAVIHDTFREFTRLQHSIESLPVVLPLGRDAVVLEISKTLVTGINSLYQELCHLGGIRPLPESLRVLEFSAATTGYTEELFNEVFTIAEGLTIDVTQSKPQEGFGRSIPLTEVQHILETPGAHLYCLKYENQAVGFHTLLAERSCFPNTLLDALQFVQEQNVLPQWTRIGGCEIFGISKSARSALAHQGIRASTVMHEAMIESARAEQLDALIAVCRQGPQANTAALNSHVKHGWQVVGHIMRDTTPYAVILLPVSEYYQQRQLPAPLLPADVALQELERHCLPPRRRIRELAERTPFEPSSPTEAMQIALQAPSISEGNAIQVLTHQLDGYVDTIVPLQCTEGLCLQARASGVFFAARQTIPGHDFWSYIALSDETITGTIATIGEAIRKDMARILD
jgi:hypothetical protein